MGIRMVEEYEATYGHVPEDPEERLAFIKSKVKTDRTYAGIIDEEIKRIKGIKWTTIEFTFFLVPKATPRPRLACSGHFYVKGAADNKRFFKEYVETIADLPMIVTPCKFYCTSFLPTPRAMKVLEQLLAEMRLLRPIKKPDFDNLAKTYSDMIQGTLLYDDALIVEGVSKKYYSVKPRIEIRIEYMNDFDSEFNRKHIMSQIN